MSGMWTMAVYIADKLYFSVRLRNWYLTIVIQEFLRSLFPGSLAILSDKSADSRWGNSENGRAKDDANRDGVIWLAMIWKSGD